MFWIVLKLLVIYLFLILIFRFLGKREVGELSIFDLVILLMIADIASLGLDNNDLFLSGLVCVFVLAILQKILSFLMLKFPKGRKVVDGSPTVIVSDGMIHYKNMAKELYTIDDLISQMHQQYIMDISDIRLAILETNGTLSIFRSERFDDVIIPIIVSGIYNQSALKFTKYLPNEITEKLTKHGFILADVLYATIKDGYLCFYYANKKEELLRINRIVL